VAKMAKTVVSTEILKNLLKTQNPKKVFSFSRNSKSPSPVRLFFAIWYFCHDSRENSNLCRKMGF